MKTFIVSIQDVHLRYRVKNVIAFESWAFSSNKVAPHVFYTLVLEVCFYTVDKCFLFIWSLIMHHNKHMGGKENEKIVMFGVKFSLCI
ncbi:hypothetical protein J2S15_000661 [Breznakia pachnodae]|uniref:Uncharacterized protein n=1 Tax=Breznakia pachnodae TaxID=265178 RepID=A0ABU0E056_9FIRM|nr:hypothetical protein [Breznakia pachnodae]